MNEVYVENEDITEEDPTVSEELQSDPEVVESTLPFEPDTVETDEVTEEETLEMTTEVVDSSYSDLVTDRLDIIAVSSVLTCCLTFLVLVRLIKR